MDGYIVLPTFNENLGVLGLSKNIFGYIATQSIKSFKEIIRRKDFNIVTVTTRDETVVFRMLINVKKGINKDSIKEELINDITSRIEVIADGLPLEFHIKVIEL
jgi:predicted small metal-binding protein